MPLCKLKIESSQGQRKELSIINCNFVTMILNYSPVAVSCAIKSDNSIAFSNGE